MKTSKNLSSVLAISSLILAMLACNFGKADATPTPLPPTNPPPTAIPPTEAPPVVEASPTPAEVVPSVDTSAFETQLQEFADEGYVSTTEGEITPIDPFEEEWAQLNYYQWWTIDKEASDLVFSGHFKWSSSNSTPDLSGCGVVFGLQEGEYNAICTTLQPYLFYEKMYNFSDLYLMTGPVLVTPVNSKYTSLSQFSGLEIGFQEGSNAALILEKYPNPEECLVYLDDDEIKKILASGIGGLDDSPTFDDDDEEED
ncbi:MAG TPA: transporter substrate-binding domain-containing protein, partial [Anaerolineales bacterium]|nr:transporter substrate-binding domain-containing protein [Anaerolineales bacterium]